MEPSVPSIDVRELRDAVEAIEKGLSQAVVLGELLKRASRYCQRIALFIIQGGNAVGWKAMGFTGSGTLPNEQIKNVTIPLTMGTTFKEVYETSRSFVGSASEEPGNMAIFEKIGDVDPVEILICPLLFRGKIAALVYGDSGNSAEGIPSSDSVELLTRVASSSIDLIPIKERYATARAEAPAAPKAPPVEKPAAPAMPRTPVAGKPTPSPPVEAPRRAPAAPAGLEALSDEEKKLHSDAKRLARVLISDLILYNEAKVATGRKNKNLYPLLKDDIDRSKQMYDQRATPKVARIANYFNEELINTLAQGDASALKGYPGLS
jgi:hypothetical protein